MRYSSQKDSPGDRETKLAMHMQAVVEARNCLDNARARLRSVEDKLRGGDPSRYENQRTRALGEYIAAVGKAKQARTELLKQLRMREA